MGICLDSKIEFAYLYAKQKHLGYKKVGGQSVAAVSIAKGLI